MKYKVRILFFAVVLCWFCPSVSAQSSSLPVLPDDKNIVRGTLPDGLTYYVCRNKSNVGLMDISLVQKTAGSVSEQEASADARGRFSAMCFANTDLQSFLVRSGIYPDRDGFIRVDKGSVEYRFRNMSSAFGERTADSTFYAVFKLADLALRHGMGTSNQAIVVSGDFDQNALVKRMEMLSVVCPKVDVDPGQSEYVWNEVHSCEIAVDTLAAPKSGVGVTWRLQRTPRQYMKTVLPVIFTKMAHEFEQVLRYRLDAALSDAGIDYLLDFRYLDSGACVGDETISLSVLCAPQNRDAAMKILNEELSRLRTWGVSEQEYCIARDAYKWKWKSEVANPRRSNAEYVQKCKANFLQGASLSTEEYKMSVVYRSVQDSTQTRLFNQYLLPIVGQSAGEDASLERFHRPQSRASIKEGLASRKSAEAVKLPKDKSEYVTGGQIWSFPGGIQVIYKQMATKGFTYYTYAAKGGKTVADKADFASIDNIAPGDFSMFLDAEGIRLNVDFNPTDVRLSGEVPSENIETMFQVLVAMTSKEATKGLFSDKCFKILVLAGDYPADMVKRQLGWYIGGLGESGSWTSARISIATDTAEYKPEDGGTEAEYVTKLDLTSANFSLQNLAMKILRNALVQNLSKYSVNSSVEGSFVGFPSDKYVVRMRVNPVSETGFDLDAVPADEDVLRTVMYQTVGKLASNQLSSVRLKIFKAMARDAFNSIRTTPWYYIAIACDRYLDNRNLAFNYETTVNTVSAERLQKFFKDVTPSDTNR